MMLHMLVGLLFCMAGLYAAAVIAGSIAADFGKIARALGRTPAANLRLHPVRHALLRGRPAPLRSPARRERSPLRAAA